MASLTITGSETDNIERLDRLLDEVLERRKQPEDQYEIAAILESLGWNDSRVSRTFGFEDVFELASDLWHRSRSRVLYSPFAKAEAMTFWQLFTQLIRTFLRGVIFAFPMAVSVFSMLTLKFSLWSYENLSVELATAIAIGTIFSFVTVGGFTQAIARRGFFYMIQGYYNMARRVTFRFIGLGFIVCVLLSAGFFMLNMIIQMFPFRMVAIIILYFFFLNTIWLSVTVMYILKKELLFTGLIIFGVGVVYVLFKLLGINIMFAQLVSLSLVSIVSILSVVWLFKRAEKRAERGIQPQLPKMSVTLYSTMPYFIYGLLYFALLYADRVMAWSTNNEYTMPYLIWFRGEYELGLDFALLVLIVPMGIAEVVLTKLMMDIEVSQKSYWGDETDKMNRTFERLYYRRLLVIGGIAAASAAGLYYSLYALLNFLQIPLGRTLFAAGPDGGIGLTHLVFLLALAAYVFLSVALMNAVILFSLSQPFLVLRDIWPSFLVNVVTGFLMSRWFGYEYAAVGLLLGSVLFMILSTRSVRKVFRHLDFYLYAAS
ncbi:hypothetical protein BG53_07745 [Paenibacillus darwinianus]|uniref:Uncharacterized protein n=1 Tax=Paenibacillus darwinianus TaxID=1380763 RepID=A0A9W5W6I5_9BACL|nr:hypothetical protein [Paenibacillus darwinianus]EXX84801.1 hypothetical protein BG52_09840 [Paenibacillus darwinianus]EXX85667.1 hypothetical protein CH50_08995 [Paenibacillus darwinianus]EXX85726.1 hypothetical protein BG53_07745 [Paenibacillus darwinianus]